MSRVFALTLSGNGLRTLSEDRLKNMGESCMLLSNTPNIFAVNGQILHFARIQMIIVEKYTTVIFVKYSNWFYSTNIVAVIIVSLTLSVDAILKFVA